MKMLTTWLLSIPHCRRHFTGSAEVCSRNFYFISHWSCTSRRRRCILIQLNVEVVEVIFGCLNVNLKFWRGLNNICLMTSTLTYCQGNVKLLHECKKKPCFSPHFVFLWAWMKIASWLPSESLLTWSSAEGRPCLSSPRSEWEILSLRGDSLYSCTHKKDKETDELRHAVESHKIFTLGHRGTMWILAGVKRWLQCLRRVFEAHMCYTQMLFKVKKLHAQRISCCLSAEL